MRILVTGHTGFKGSWLTLLLHERGHAVSGLALDPEPGALYERARVGAVVEADVRCDIRDGARTVAAIRELEPEAIIHLAAQPLVRRSYEEPRLTVETNVMGTLAVLEGALLSGSAQAVLVITTDKVYRNVGSSAGYVESDPLGGHDPYSASKAMADILAASWQASFAMPPLAVARAGNVIGGGDVSTDRLMPDLLRAFEAGVPAQVRYPDAVRPWQHVLDCLEGYVLLLDELLSGSGQGAWNFGPPPSSFATVAEAADLAASAWGSGASWMRAHGDHPHEAELLTLDSARARASLGWQDRLSLREAITWTVEWQRRAGEADPRAVTLDQIRTYERLRNAT